MHTLRYTACWSYQKIAESTGFHVNMVKRICGQPATLKGSKYLDTYISEINAGYVGWKLRSGNALQAAAKMGKVDAKYFAAAAG